ncbi:unnamed protein product [Zymoseptoria tritici ST99CH_3D1]|nr:unnamed protein product [Zymoseptoria tritici ST99CH_3D1]
MAIQLEAHTSRQILSSLITSIPSPAPSQHGQNPLHNLSPDTRNIFLTLYAQFEKEFLPALDLLDRGLVTRLQVRRPNSDTASSQKDLPYKPLYLVRSAQQHHTRHGPIDHSTHYEVHLEAWSCSCPAFTLAAFPAVSVTDEGRGSTAASRRGPLASDDPPCVFGGVTRGEDTPVCKHLLACVLVRNCEMFEGFVEVREVEVEELAGWAAGWGD